MQMAGISFLRHRRATTLALIVALVCAGSAGAQKHLVTFKLRKNNRDDVTALAFSPDGLTLAARINRGWPSDGKLWGIALYDVESKKQVGTIKGGFGYGFIAFSNDSRSLVVSTQLKKREVVGPKNQAGEREYDLVEVFDVKTRKRLRKAELPARSAYRGWVLPGDKVLLALGVGEVRRYDFKTLKKLSDFDLANFGDVAVAPDGTRLALADIDGTLTVYEVKTGKKVFAVEDTRDYLHPHAVAFAPDGKSVAVLNPTVKTRVQINAKTRVQIQGEIVVYSVPGGKQLKKMAHKDLMSLRPPMFYLPDGKTVACREKGRHGFRTVPIGDALPLFAHKGDHNTARCLAFTPMNEATR